jgi:hypothetical protein
MEVTNVALGLESEVSSVLRTILLRFPPRNDILPKNFLQDVPWYIPNTILKRDLQIPTVKQEARKYSANYRKQLDAHPNNLANALFKEQQGNRRLKRLYPADLVTNG